MKAAAKGSLLVFDLVTGTALKGSADATADSAVDDVIEEDQADEEPNGSKVFGFSGVFVKFLAENGSKESSKLLVFDKVALFELLLKGSQASPHPGVSVVLEPPKGSVEPPRAKEGLGVSFSPFFRGRVPKASSTEAVKGSCSFLKGSAPSNSKGSPYRWLLSLKGSSLKSRAE